MKFFKKHTFVSKYFPLIIVLFLSFLTNAQDARFTVVLDAGHGGHDPGAIGSFSKEKDINLSMALTLGGIIEQNYKDVNVVFSRKTDRYLTLQERADVVNNHHADLFICIHTNSAQSSSAYGTETFTLGLAKTRANLDVAMRENSVILLEEDYKTKYKGFDPNSVDSYIMFEFMQDKYIDRSIDFSSSIQKQFVNYSHRSDRGVRQAGFWVLHRSACPSVLIELGFISNPSEERYLNSEAGQKEMATAIFNAFVDYKRVHDKKSGKQLSGVLKYETPIKKEEIVKSEEPVKIEEPKKAAEPVKITPVAPKLKEKTIIDSIVPKAIEIKNKVVSEPKSINIPTFKVQFLASMKPLKSTSAEFKGLKDFEHYIEGGLYKYTVGNETDYSKIVTIRKGLLSKFPEAFIIAFVNEKKMTAKEALKLIK